MMFVVYVTQVFLLFDVEFNLFTSDSVTTKTDKFSEITDWVKLKNKQQNWLTCLVNIQTGNGL